MKPIRTPDSTTCYALPGGNEDNFLYAELVEGVVKSVWTPDADERRLIAGGAPVVLLIWGALVPPVALGIERPYCRNHKERMRWDEEQQSYACAPCAAAAADPG